MGLEDRTSYARRIDAGKPSGAAIGLILPGYPQWQAGRKGAAVFQGSAVASVLAASVVAWGSPVAVILLALAFLIHASSVADAIRGLVFPPLSWWAPWTSSALSLGTVVYGPALLLATATAMPIFPRGYGDEGFAVNQLAYRIGQPRKGEIVLVDDIGIPGPWVGRVVASAGERLLYPYNDLAAVHRTPEIPLKIGRPGGTGWIVNELDVEIPAHHALVAVIQNNHSNPGDRGERLLLVDQTRLIGKAWARIHSLGDPKAFLWASHSSLAK